MALLCLLALVPNAAAEQGFVPFRIYPLPDPTRHYLLTDLTSVFPGPEGDRLSVSVAPGEFEPASFVIRASAELSDVRIEATSLVGAGARLDPSTVDIRVVKTWWQHGDGTDGSHDGQRAFLLPELLLKDDALVETTVDRLPDGGIGGESSLRLTSDGEPSYLSLASYQPRELPPGATVEDATTLQPFSIALRRSKQIWITVRPPIGTAPGTYSGTLTVSAAGQPSKKIALSVQVHPFTLSVPLLEQALCYRGKLSDSDEPQLRADTKTHRQLLEDLRNMRDHGVDYPVVYQDLYTRDKVDPTKEQRLREHLSAMAAAGLPQDKLYQMGDGWAHSAVFKQWQRVASSLGWANIYFFGEDEATGAAFDRQVPGWKGLQASGAKVFASIPDYETSLREAVGVLNQAILYGYVEVYHPGTVARIQQTGVSVFMYGFPFSGFENPGFERFTYGFRALASGYRGTMNYAFQADFGGNHSIEDWIEFHAPRNGVYSRVQNYTYPTSTRPLDTLQWEAHREGIDDIRYVSTLAGLRGWTAAQAQEYLRKTLVPNPGGYFPFEPKATRSKVVEDLASALRDIPPAGHWTFDTVDGTKVSDSSASKKHAVRSAGTRPTKGRFGAALELDGVRGMLEVPDSAFTHVMNDLSVSIWFRPSAGGSGGVLLTTGSVSTALRTFTVRYRSDGHLELSAAGKEVHPAIRIESRAPITADEWHHVMVVLGSDRTARLFVDGEPQSQTTAPNDATAPAAPRAGSALFVGGTIAPHASGPTLLRGAVDDLRIYHRALQSDEVVSMSTGAYGFEDTSGDGAILRGTHAGVTFPVGEWKTWRCGMGFANRYATTRARDTTASSLRVPAKRVLKSIRLSSAEAVDYAIESAGNPTVAGRLAASRPVRVVTTWSHPSSQIFLRASGNAILAIDDLEF